MADEGYGMMSDQDFDHNEEDPRLTRVIVPQQRENAHTVGKDAALTVEEIADGLQNVSMLDESSSNDEDDEPIEHDNKPNMKTNKEKQPEKTIDSKKQKKNKIAVIKPTNNSKHVEKMHIDQIKPKTKTRKERKAVADSDEEEYPSEDCPSTSTKHTSYPPDLMSGYSSVVDQAKSITSPECLGFIKDADSDQSEDDHAETVEDTKPIRARTKKGTKGSAKTKLPKTEVDLEENNKGNRRGKKATAIVAPNSSEPTEKETVIVKSFEKTKGLKKGATVKEDKPKPEDSEDLHVEIKIKKPAEKKAPNKDKVKRGKEPEQPTYKEGENDEDSSDEKINVKPSRIKTRANQNESDNLKENKTNNKKTGIGSNDLNALDDNIVGLPVATKGKKKNLLKGNNETKENQPLNEMNFVQEAKPDAKKRNVKNFAHESDLQYENNTNIPETKSAPKKRNMKSAPQPVEVEPRETVDVQGPKDNQTKAKEKLTDKEQKQPLKPRKGGKKVQVTVPPVETKPEENSRRVVTRSRK